MKKIDLRSDTVTQPSQRMREAMCSAEVGDDIMGEDPTVNQLEAYTANLLGKDAALFVTSGTQGNLLSVMSHCGRGEEFIAGSTSHLFKWEAGGSAVLGSVYPQPIDFENDGTLDLEKVKKAIKPDDPHFAITKLLALENTQGGKVLPLNYLKKASEFAKAHHLKTHLDGARVFNAAVALDISVNEIAKYFDSVTFCLSKGLGCPVGSLICADRDIIVKARRLRKMVGGSMRQAGILAAAGLFALEQNVSRLAEDHQNAAYLAQKLSELEQLRGKVQAHTNMIFINAGIEGHTALPQFLLTRGIIIWGGDVLRLVTHLDVTRDDMDAAFVAFKDFYDSHLGREHQTKTKKTIY
jgi:threonine aldolase